MLAAEMMMVRCLWRSFFAGYTAGFLGELVCCAAGVVFAVGFVHDL